MLDAPDEILEVVDDLRQVATGQFVVRRGRCVGWMGRHVFCCASNENWNDLVVLAQEQPNNVVDVANQRVRAAVATICLLGDRL